VFEADDVTKGLLNLITLHGITTLVMGAAQNKYYTMYVCLLSSLNILENFVSELLLGCAVSTSKCLHSFSVQL
jgi:hypothetical protein